jgi:hypothetical protein
MAALTMSEDQVSKWNTQVATLKASNSLEDKIAGILMDMNVGSSGFPFEVSKEKAKAILELLGKSP